MLSIVLFLVSSEDSEYGVLDFNVFRQAECLAQTDYYRCAREQLDEEHPYRTQVQQREGEDAGAHYCGHAEGRKDVPYLRPHGVAYQLAAVHGIQPVADYSRYYPAPKHPVNVYKDSETQGTYGNYFLYYLQFQEQVRPTLYLKHVQVDGVQRIQAGREAEYLQVMRRLLPLRADKNHDQRFCHRCKSKEKYKGGQHRGTDYFPVTFLHALAFVLDGTQHRVAHTLHY